MTKLLEKAIAEIRWLPVERQDEAAEILLELAAQDSGEWTSSAPNKSLTSRKRLASPPDYATDAEAMAVIRRLTR